MVVRKYNGVNIMKNEITLFIMTPTFSNDLLNLYFGLF